MRYLKTYKLFEANWYDIKDHIKVLSDMSLPLCDKDFNVQVSDQSITKYIRGIQTIEGKCILVNIVKNGSAVDPRVRNKFTCSEIKEELLDMVHYMDSEGWEILDIRYLHDIFGSQNCKLEGDELITVDGNRKVNGWIEKLGVKFVEKKEVKTNESTEEDVHRELMIKKYGAEEIEECDEVIRNISDMALEVEDLGITVLVGYSPMTYMSAESTPKISVSVIADAILFAGNIADIDIFTDTLLDYVKSLGFSTGKNCVTFTTDRKMTRQILIQK